MELPRTTSAEAFRAPEPGTCVPWNNRQWAELVQIPPMILCVYRVGSRRNGVGGSVDSSAVDSAGSMCLIVYDCTDLVQYEQPTVRPSTSVQPSVTLSVDPSVNQPLQPTVIPTRQQSQSQYAQPSVVQPTVQPSVVQQSTLGAQSLPWNQLDQC